MGTVTEVHTANIELLEGLHPLDRGHQLRLSNCYITAVEREEGGLARHVGLSDSDVLVSVERVE